MFCNHPSWLYAPPGMQQKWIGWMGWCWCCDIFGEWGIFSICICAQFLSTFEVHTMQTNSLKKTFMPKSNICGHIMPTNNLKHVFYLKALVKIEHVRKQSLFVSSGLMVFTQCVCMSCILSLAIVLKWAALQRQHISQRLLSDMGW